MAQAADPPGVPESDTADLGWPIVRRVVEVTTFRLADGVSTDVFEDADKRFQCEFAYAQPGLVRRTVARTDDGDWLVVTLWRSPADADAALRRSGEDEAARRYLVLLESSSVRTTRYRELDAAE
jgi:hypothetical protein